MSQYGTGIDSKTLADGSECPPRPADGRIQVYSMRYCPYAERILLALELKNIKFDVVNCNLSNKPSWFVGANPLGKAPVLIHDNQVIYESILTVEYLETVFPSSGAKLVPATTVELLKQKMLIELISSKVNQAYAIYPNLNNKDVLPEKLAAYEKAIQYVENLFSAEFLTGSSPSFVDYMMWPWFERISMVMLLIGKNTVAATSLKLEQFPKIVAYRERMLKIAPIAAITRSNESHVAFIESAFLNKQPNYDV